MFVNENKGKTEKKNIYDVAGNVWEWTTEIPMHKATNSVFRGAAAINDGSVLLATNRNGSISSTTGNSSSIGFRLVLYVK